MKKWNRRIVISLGLLGLIGLIGRYLSLYGEQGDDAKGKSVLLASSWRQNLRKWVGHDEKAYLRVASPDKGENGAVDQLSGIVRNAAAKILKSVVSLSVVVKPEGYDDKRNIPFSPFMFPFPGLEDFFGIPQRPQEIQGGGSGFLISQRYGYILTNCHVVVPSIANRGYQPGQEVDLNAINKNTKITVKSPSGKVYPALKIQGASPDWDLAVLKIDPVHAKDFEDAEFAPEPVRIGDLVLAAGSPFGLESSITMGIVSGVDRSDLMSNNYGQPLNLSSFIQTDAAINPGNSGGPLVNLQGQVVGVSTALIGPQYNVGIGLAIPADVVLNVVPILIETGSYKRGTLGANVLDLSLLDDTLKKENLIDTDLTGVMIQSVLKGSNAEAAGLEAGDVIYSWNGKPLKNAADLIRHVASSLDQKVVLGILRRGKKMNVEVTIKTFTPSDEGSGQTASKTLQKLGLLEAHALTPEEAQQRFVSEGFGILVKRVADKGLFKKLDIRPGDIIVYVNQKEVKTLRSLERYLDKGEDFRYLVTFYREGIKMTVLFNQR